MKAMKKLRVILISLCCALLCGCIGFAVSLTSVFTAKAETTVNTTTDMRCDGASIRVNMTDKKNGIRFHVRVAGGETKSYPLDVTSLTITTGTLVIPTDKLTGELTKDTAKAANVETTGKWTEVSETVIEGGVEKTYYYMESVVYVYNIPSTSMEREFSFRGYYEKEGVTYYTDDTDSRSLSYIALQESYAKANGEVGAKYDSATLRELGFLPQRIKTKLPNVDKFLYRVGNANEISLSSLFATDENFVDDSNPAEITGVTCTCDNESVSMGELDGAITLDTKIQFNGTGVVTLSVTEKYSRTTELKLEVINATNATTAMSATANDVVLLNDISGTFTVSNGHTFYGNGFTVKLPTTSVQNVGNGFTGYISIGAAQDDGIANGGNLDNVRIEGPVYPEMYIYRKQAEITDSSDADYGDGYNMRYFKNSVIVYGGNCTISNSYISGSRTALCLRGGNNVVIENTTLSGGAYANMQICAGSSVTLRDVTTEQKDVTDSYGKGKTAHGMGIAVDSNVVDLYIEGELTQYNWLNQSQWNTIVPSAYKSSFPKFFTDNAFSKYWHYLNGGTDPYVNMAFIFACNWDTSKIHDNRTTVDYGTTNATIAGVSGGVYSKLNTVGGNAITNEDIAGVEYIPTGFNPVAPTFTFDNTPNNDDDDENDENDTYCVYNESTGTLKIGITGSSKTLDLSNISVVKNGTELTFTQYLNGTEFSGNSVTINVADGTKQTLTFKATSSDCGYDKDGNPIEGEIDYTWTVTVEVATLAYPKPVWNMGGSYKFDASSCVYAYYSTSSGYGEAVPIYEGIKITYYNKSGTLVNLDLSGTTTLPTGSANSNDSAFKYTLPDGSTLTMKFSSGWKSGATTHQFTTYNKKVYIYPQSLDNDNYIRAKTTNQDFDVKITYTFTDPNGQSTEPVTMNWYNAAASNGSVSTVQWKTFDSTNGKKPSICIVEGTLITLADGTQKAVEDLLVGDMVLAFNHFTGMVEAKPFVAIAHKDEVAQSYNILNLQFSDGTIFRIVGHHGLFDRILEEYIMIAESNVAEYIGHEFYVSNIVNGEYVSKNVVLTNYYITTETVRVFSPVTEELGNYFANGLLNVGPLHRNTLTCGHINYFDFDENLKYDEEKMQADIEKCGLYTYEEFADYISEELFDALSFKYYKIAVEKGLMTKDDILGLIYELNNT